MNKLQKQSLNDYLTSNLDDDLKMLVFNFNPVFSINKSNKSILINLIKKIKSEPANKLRVQALESYLKPTYVEKKEIKSSEIPKLTKSIAMPKDAKLAAKQAQLEDLRKSYVRGFKNLSAENSTRQADLKDKIDFLEQELGKQYTSIDQINPDRDIERKESIVRACLGDWQAEGTIAWQLLNTNQSGFEIYNTANVNQLTYDMNEVLKYLKEITGRKLNVAAWFDKKEYKWVISSKPVSFAHRIKNDQGGTIDPSMLGRLMDIPTTQRIGTI